MNKSFFRTICTLAAILMIGLALSACCGESKEAALVEGVTQSRSMDVAESIPDPVLDYILNTNSKRFHYPDCPSVDQMKESNKKAFTGTRTEAVAKGYLSCGNCNS